MVRFFLLDGEIDAGMEICRVAQHKGSLYAAEDELTDGKHASTCAQKIQMFQIDVCGFSFVVVRTARKEGHQALELGGSY